MKQRRWYTKVPATYVDRHGKPKPVSSNHHLPRYAYRVHHAHTKNEHAVYEFLQRQKRDLGGDLGWIVHGYSVAKIAAAIGMATETVRDLLRSLAKKHSIIAWNAKAGKAEPRRRGDHGGTTSWRLPRYVDILRARRADPTIGVGGKNNKSCWVFGPGRRFLTPEEVADWGLENYSFEEHGIRSAVIGSAEEDFAVSEDAMSTDPKAKKALPTAASPPGASPPKDDTFPVQIKGWLRNATRTDCTPEVGRKVVAAARAKAAEMGTSITDAEIIMLLERMREKATGKKFKGVFFLAIAEHVEWLIDEERPRQAAEAPRNADREREYRIGAIVSWLEILDDSSLTESDKVPVRELLAAAAADEVAAARERFALRATG